MKMIVGLGNPGPRYAKNRHNIGFQCVDLFSERHQIPLDKMQHRARLGSGWVQDNGRRQRVLLVKPLTYMNASGEAVAPLARYYRIAPEEILVIHDDLDLEAGRLRLRRNGSSGGQRGVQSIINQLGSQDFHRARVGIGRPPGRMDPAAYVLQDFSPQEEAEIFGPLRVTVCDAVVCWLFEGIEAAMNRFNR
ncbi:peptidyl-tRNA hydrolase [Litorilinea aerophila]|nr:peptidyl-tRNA hydrolase [Litorilinea aerophila]